MAQVRIMLMPSDLRHRTIHIIEPKHAAQVKLVLDAQYLVLPPMEIMLQPNVHVKEGRMGEALSGEVFDLTNNPSRWEERMERYGNGRSLSSGDVVRTPEGDFLCCSIGWAKL